MLLSDLKCIKSTKILQMTFPCKMVSCSEVPGNRSDFQLEWCFMCYSLPRRNAGHEESMADRYVKFPLGTPAQANPRG